jgi:hypothetical protein
VDGRGLLAKLVASRRNGVALDQLDSRGFETSLPEIERTFDSLLGDEVQRHSRRLASLAGLLDNDSAYQHYQGTDFSRLNRLRELLLGLL